MLLKLKKTYYGIVSVFLIFFNISIVIVPILFFTFLKVLVPIKSFQYFCVSALEFFASFWVGLNVFATKLISPTEIEIELDSKLDSSASYLIIANHRSWLDTLILQIAFHKKIAFPKFFMKREMLYVPFIGLGCWALDFPTMRRYSKEYLEKHPEKKGKDIEETKEYCRKIPKRPTTIINFVEGTRRTVLKAKKSNYKNLLNPKAGGIAVILGSLEDRLVGVLNTTIVYESENESLLRFICRETKRIKVKIEFIPIEDIPFGGYFDNQEDKEGFQCWLNTLWQKNDDYITGAQKLLKE